MNLIRLRAMAALGWLLLPALVLQGLWLRCSVPRLGEAAGPPEGEVAGAVPEKTPPLRLLLLGESTVAGVGASNHQQGLAGGIAASLAGRTGLAVRWRALGRNGLTARALRTELLASASNLRADVAVIALGVNDSVRLNRPGRWTQELDRLIRDLRNRCGCIPVFLAALPPMGDFPALPQPTRWVLGTRAQLLDRASRALAERSDNVFHVPLPTQLEGHISEYFAGDGFHPSPAGYRVWGESLAERISDVLRPGLGAAPGERSGQ